MTSSRPSPSSGSTPTSYGPDQGGPPVPVVLVGAGSVVESLYLPVLTRTDSPFRVVAVHDVNPTAAERVAGLLGTRVAGSLADAVAADAAAAFVCVPKESHGDIVRRVVDRGLHVLCEKPLGRDGSEAAEMLEAATSAGVTHMVNFAYRFRPGPALGRRMLDSGALGDVYHVQGVLAQGRWFTPEATPSFERPNATPWRFGPEGGVVRDLGPHLVDMCLPLGEPAWVQAWTKTYQANADAPEDTSGFSLGFLNGPVAHLLVSRWATGHWEKLDVEISGALGAVRFNRHQASTSRPSDEEWRAAPAPEDRSTFLHVFRRAIDGQADEVPTFRDGALNNAVLDAVLQSAQAGATVAVNTAALQPTSTPQPTSRRPEPARER